MIQQFTADNNRIPTRFLKKNPRIFKELPTNEHPDFNEHLSTSINEKSSIENVAQSSANNNIQTCRIELLRSMTRYKQKN